MLENPHTFLVKTGSYRTISEKNINALNTLLDFLESHTEKFCIPIPEIVGEGENP